jgi:hypothetical protein
LLYFEFFNKIIKLNLIKLFFFFLIGVTGRVVIDNSGERMAEFVMYDMNPKTFEFEPVISSAIEKNNHIILEYNETRRPIFWHKIQSGNLSDSPKCGYNNAKCPIKGKNKLTRLRRSEAAVSLV